MERPVLRFLSRTEVAHYLGMKSLGSLTAVELPPHDAEIGDRKGWLPGTIDVWNAARPGRGRWGQRIGGQGRAGVVRPPKAKLSRPVLSELSRNGWARTLEVACPTCKAVSEQPCDSPRKKGVPHRSRQDRALRTIML